MARVPKLGTRGWLFLIADYPGPTTFQTSSCKNGRSWARRHIPAYDLPQTLQTVRQWFREAGLTDVEVHYGHNGIEGHGRNLFGWSGAAENRDAFDTGHAAAG
jgi:hypothetical protein